MDERVVDRWLSRGHRFFRAMNQAPIRSALLARGLTNAELLTGWGYYSNVMGQGRGTAAPAPAPSQASAAMDELDAWDAPNFKAAKAILHPTPKARAFLFDNLEAATGPDAVVAVKTFVNRWEQLRSNEAEGVSKKEGSEAADRLASRRIIDVDKARQLRELIVVAQRGAQPSSDAEAASATAGEFDEAEFENFRAWLNEWREVARATFTRRDYLISLGLASRRSAEEEDETDDSDAATTEPSDT